MSARILDGRAVAAGLRAQTVADAARIAARGLPPTLAIMKVGEDVAISAYTKRLLKEANAVGVSCTVEEYPAEIDQDELIHEVRALNGFMAVDGILIPFPLPRHLDPSAVAAAISPNKDIDGISPANAGGLVLGRESAFCPNTPLGGMEILHTYAVPIAGAEAVVVGRSAIVGKPMAQLLLRANATVTVCHTRTRDLGAVTRRADILVVAAGHPGLITGDMIEPGATVIDFGTNVTRSGTVGDVDFASAMLVAGQITPVPGGTGPVTTQMLFRSLIRACGL